MTLPPTARALQRLLLLRPLPGFALKYLYLYHEALAIEHEEEMDRADARDWARDENRSMRVGRSLFALVAGGYLLWAQDAAVIFESAEWGRWVKLSVVANALIPLVIVHLFFAQGLRRHGFHKYLPDQRLVAWRFGWEWGRPKRYAALSLGMFSLMLPALWIASRDPGAQAFYRSYFPPVYDARSWGFLLGTLVLYMACWEWFFRGFLLFSLAQGFGGPAAIVIQAAMFGLSHWGKPPLEMASSFAGGLVLGWVAWREKSFVPAFWTHALVHVAWAVLVLRG